MDTFGKLADDTQLGRADDNQTLVLLFRRTSTEKTGREMGRELSGSSTKRNAKFFMWEQRTHGYNRLESSFAEDIRVHMKNKLNKIQQCTHTRKSS